MSSRGTLARLREGVSRDAGPEAGITAGLRLESGVLAATLHRRRMRDLIVVGITGSAGKTTAKELAAAVLASTGRGRRSPAEANDLATVAKTVLRTTTRSRWCVVEVAAGRRIGLLDRKARVLRPTIAVVTNVGRDHRAIFRTLTATAAEKRLLLEHLTPDGTAILNADDPLVVGMAEGLPQRVITYGTSADADLRAVEIDCAWPSPLSLVARYRGEAVRVRTQLLGDQWTGAVLAALGVGLAAGVRLDAAARAIATMPPLPERMRPVMVGEVTFVDDSLKAPVWAMDSTFRFLAGARAERKILVVGTLADYSATASVAYRRVADGALEAADEVVFVGPNAPRAVRKNAPAVQRLRTVPSTAVAAEYLAGILCPGDLVVLKGSRNADQLGRIPGLVAAATGRRV